MSCNVSILAIRRLALLAGVMLLIPSVVFGAYSVTAGQGSRNTYEDQIYGAGHAEGDIWGGEQGSDPWLNPEGPIPTETVPIINTTPILNPGTRPKPGPKAGHAGWLVQLASFFDWFQTSLRFPNSR